MLGKPVIWRWIVVAVITIAAMSWGYSIIRDNQKVKSSLPVFGPQDGDRDHKIADFKLTDQLGKQITQADFKGKIYVADFFFATCQSICPMMSDQMERISEKYKGNQNVMMLSHTVKPDEDSVPALLEYAKLHNADPATWHFVTGDLQQINDLARYSYLVGGSEMASGTTDFVHTQFFALIDPHSRIRGFYDGTDSVAVNKLMGDIETLLKEEE